MTVVSDTAQRELTPYEQKLADLRDASLPVMDYTDALKHFRRPFAPAAIKWKVQTEWGSGALIVGYIDVRLVIERLNLVWPWWDKDTVAAGQGAARCYLVLRQPDTGGVGDDAVLTRKTDVGQGGDVKTMESDAMKRAAVHLGIGVSVYALKQVRLKVGEGDGELRTETKRKRNRDKQLVEAKVPVLDDRTTQWLDAGYARWLAAKGEALFGPVLDHGDEPDAQGMDTESPAAAAAATGGEPPAPEVNTASPAEQIQGERPDELRAMASGVFAQLRKLKPKAMTPGAFQGRLQEAGATSVEALEALVDELEAMVRDAGGGGS